MSNLDSYVYKERLKWRSRRSMLELDLYFERFIASGLFDVLSLDELKHYEEMLALDDGDLLLLVQAKHEHSDTNIQTIVNKLIAA